MFLRTKKPLMTSHCVVVAYPGEAYIDVKRFTLFLVKTVVIIPLFPSTYPYAFLLGWLFSGQLHGELTQT